MVREEAGRWCGGCPGVRNGSDRSLPRRPLLRQIVLGQPAVPSRGAVGCSSEPGALVLYGPHIVAGTFICHDSETYSSKFRVLKQANNFAVGCHRL